MASRPTKPELDPEDERVIHDHDEHKEDREKDTSPLNRRKTGVARYRVELLRVELRHDAKTFNVQDMAVNHNQDGVHEEEVYPEVGEWNLQFKDGEIQTSKIKDFEAFTYLRRHEMSVYYDPPGEDGAHLVLDDVADHPGPHGHVQDIDDEGEEQAVADRN